MNKDKTILGQAILIAFLIIIVFVLVFIIYFQHRHINALEGQAEHWYRECLRSLE